MLSMFWPRPVLCRPPADMLDHPPGDFDIREAERRFLATCAPGNRERLLDAFAQIEDAGLDRHSNDDVVFVDIDGAKVQWMRGVSPCLIRTRAAARDCKESRSESCSAGRVYPTGSLE